MENNTEDVRTSNVDANCYNDTESYRRKLYELYEVDKSAIVLSEIHRIILREIDEKIASFSSIANLENQSREISSIIGLASDLPDSTACLVINKLASSKILDRKSARERIDAIRPHKEEPVVKDCKVQSDPGNQPFHCLGYNSGIYYYLPIGAKQITELRPRDHVPNNMIHLAPIQYWERAYSGEGGIKWINATNSLMRRCQDRGVFDEDRIRGRGAWWEDGEPVLHVGDRVIRGGIETLISDMPLGKYLYQIAPTMDMYGSCSDNRPLQSSESKKLADLIGLLNWDKPIFSRYMSGWIALAPICGSLQWRPHLWLTAKRGAGKSWVIDNIVRRAIGQIALYTKSVTTEAGIRQMLGNDARPVIFDEAEGGTKKSETRMDGVFELMRQASSDNESPMIKGTPSGKAITYRTRSCFLLSSIGITMSQSADISRVTTVSLGHGVGQKAQEHFHKMQSEVRNILTDEFISRLRKRIFGMIPVIRENIRIFSEASAAEIGTQRMGDQIGALLGGAYSLYDDSPITPDRAKEWLSKQDFSEQSAEQSISDEQLCVQRILEHVITVRDSSMGRDRTIHELLVIAMGRGTGLIDAKTAEESLQRYGIKTFDDGRFVIADSHGKIEHILDGTPWVKSWSRIIKRIPGAKSTDNVVRFAGVRVRGTILELDDEYSETEFKYGENIKDETRIGSPDVQDVQEHGDAVVQQEECFRDS